MKDDTIYNRFNSIKSLYYADRMKEISKTGLCSPVILHIYPSNRCTHNCSFCIMSEERQNLVFLDKDVLFKTLKEASEIGVEAVHFSGGGEPLTHPNILEALKKAKEYGLKVILSTNGSLLTDEAAQVCDHIRISLNAATQEVHEKLMRAKTWDKIMENLATIEDKSKVGFGFVLTHENWGDVYKLCELADNLGINFVHIRPGYLPEHDKRIQELLPAVKGLTDQAVKDFPNLNIYSVKEKFDGYWNKRKYAKCLATPMNVVVKASGKLIPCQDRLDLEFGDLNKQSLKDIWQSQEHKDLIENINCDECPRCVMTKVNEYIDNIFINNRVLREIL